MKKYQFSGHLSPLPPGIKLPMQISGEVYLVGDVEARIVELEAQLAAANKTIAHFLGPDGEQHIDKFAKDIGP